MSFSSEVKEELSKMGKYQPVVLLAEFWGYFLSGNMLETDKNYEFITENEFNIEHFYKLLFALEIDYEPEIKGKCYVARMEKKIIQKYINGGGKIEGENQKNVVKGAFLGAGSVNNPEKNYHLEMIFSSEKNSEFVREICAEYGINFKKIKVEERWQIYLKEAEEISKFLALIGANKAVLKFEDVRVMKDMKNNVNRKVNCETANLNKTIDVALQQIDDINAIKSAGKFAELPQNLKQVAILRLENPDLSLQDLGKMLNLRKIGSELPLKKNS